MSIALIYEEIHHMIELVKESIQSKLQ